MCRALLMFSAVDSLDLSENAQFRDMAPSEQLSLPTPWLGGLTGNYCPCVRTYVRAYERNRDYAILLAGFFHRPIIYRQVTDNYDDIPRHR